MVRNYKSTLSNHRDGKNFPAYHAYSPQALKTAVENVKNGNMTPFAASRKFCIPKTTLYRMVKNEKKQPTAGHPTLFSETVELTFVTYLNLVSSWGFPFDEMDLRYLAQSYLDEKHIEMPQLNNNFPGTDWAKNFLKRHATELSSRTASNIHRKRAAITPAILDEFFHNAELEFKDIPPENIINYDETNLTDNPGSQKFIFKRGVKYPERIVNNCPKSAISLMYAGTASGHLLPVYVVYKSTQMWSSWKEGGPPLTRFV